MSGAQEVEQFLEELGLASCVQAVVHQGFYTSMEALHGATYEELVDSGVRPVHAKLILSHLGSKGQRGPLATGNATSATSDEVGHFLRSVGLENCAAQLSEAGFTSLEKLGEASMNELIEAAGIKAVHARLIVSNLDSASTAGIAMTPAAQRLASIEADDTLLGGPKKKPRRRARLIACCVLVLLVLAYAAHSLSGGGAASQALGGAPTGHHKAHEGKGHKAAIDGKAEAHKPAKPPKAVA